MSKEQTPITAEEFLDAKGFSMDDFRSEQRYLLIRDSMEQYAQAKVLEALEREFFLANEEAEFYQLKEYYETEVKPKYKQINK